VELDPASAGDLARAILSALDVVPDAALAENPGVRR